MKCSICEATDNFSGHCCMDCWTQHCPDCGGITYAIEDYNPIKECRCKTYKTIDERLYVTIGYVGQMLSGTISSFVGVFGVDIVRQALDGVLDDFEKIRGFHISMGRNLINDPRAYDDAKIIGMRQFEVNQPIKDRKIDYDE